MAPKQKRKADAATAEAPAKRSKKAAEPTKAAPATEGGPTIVIEAW
jgi:hypothetical protein